MGDNLKGEIAPFPFKLHSVIEEINGALLVCIPELVAKVVHLFQENER